MGEAIEQCRGHLCIAKDGWPFAEGEVGGDDDRGALVEAADQVGVARASFGPGPYLAAMSNLKARFIALA
jgi:hypothetical protein